MIEIINGKKDGFIGEDKIYIGRRNKTYNLKASPLANVFSVKLNGRESSINKYSTYLFQQLTSRKGYVYDELMRLAHLHSQGKDLKLACWCSPKPCHGDVIKKIVLWISNNILNEDI